jgi:amino acid adenylation domain-containing protein
VTSGSAGAWRSAAALVGAQASAHPDAIAIVADEAHVSYRALDARANQIARTLLDAGVGAECLVAIALERSPALVAAILGVWKAGAAYVPLDINAPLARVSRVLELTPPTVIVTTTAQSDRLPTTDAILLHVDDDAQVFAGPPAAAAAPVDPDQAAYVIYTSGSTGEPRGVVVSHAGLPSLAESQAAHLTLTRGGRVVQLASPTFDAAVSELLMAFVVGATVVIVPDSARTGPALEHELRRHAITHATLTPSVMGSCRPDRVAVPWILSAGEACPPALAGAWRRDRTLVNAYGPTEVTVCATMSGPLTGSGVPPIGRPIGTVRVAVLDRHLDPVPAGTRGELYVAGAGVARGYASRPAWTAERFLPDPFGPPGSRMYRTGDLVSRGDDDILTFDGRADHQVKLHGVRIELGEIEAVIRELPEVRDAIAAVTPVAGDAQLVAYVVTHTGERSAAYVAHVQRHLRDRLPDAMVPAAVVMLDAVPLTAHGKTDRLALPPPEWPRQAAAARVPQTRVERELCAIFVELLSPPPDATIGVDDNFFVLGGNSLVAARAVQLIEERLQAAVSMEVFFRLPTAAALAARIEGPLPPDAAGTAVSIRRLPRDQALPLTPQQELWWQIEQLTGNINPNNAHFTLRLRGPLHVRALRQAIVGLGRRHEALRTAFVGGRGPVVAVIARVGDGDVDIAYIDLTVGRVADRTRLVESLVHQEHHRPFDLSRPPLWRFLLARLDADDHLLIVVAHHLVCDARSNDVLVTELAALYAAFRSGEPVELPDRPFEFVDFAQWQREWTATAAAAAELEYWRTCLAPPLEDLFPSTASDAPHAGGVLTLRQRVPFVVARETFAAARRLARRSGCTPASVLLTAVKVTLANWTRQRDVRVGTVVPNRDVPGADRVIGLFMTSVCLRTDIDTTRAFSELVRRVHATIGAATAHQRAPFHAVLRSLADHCPPSGLLYQVLFVWVGQGSEPWRLADLDVTVDRSQPRTPATVIARHNLLMRIDLVEDSDELTGSITYDAERFSSEAIAGFADSIERIVTAADAAPESSADALCGAIQVGQSLAPAVAL